jgi:hypothetical protein
MTDVGLFSVMPAGTVGLLFLLTASFAFSLVRRPLRPLVALVHVLVLVIALYGVTEFVEPVARFASVYRHVGIIDYISVHQAFNPAIDAYFSWPGFFALGALINKLAGFHSALAYAAWGPLVFNLLFLPPLVAIFSWASKDARITWLALWVFYSCNWVGQDYVSPQGVGFLLWLAMLAGLLKWFVPSPAGLAPAPSLRAVPRYFGPRGLRAIPADGPAVANVQSVGVLLVVLVIFGATVSGHQLTPFPVLLAVSGLAIFAGLQTPRLPLIMAVGLAAWIGYMTTRYLEGHLGTLVGPLGSVGQNLSQNVGTRVTGSPGHGFIVQMRLIGTGVIWALAAAGFARRLLSRRADVAIALIGVTPFLLLPIQPYGGEMLLRVFLFALPTVSFFIACLAFPSPDAGRGRLPAAAIAIVGCLLLTGFQFTRYGNERLDAFTRGDAAAVRALYRLAPRGSKLVAGNGNLPWRYQRYADYDYQILSDLPAWHSRYPEPVQLLLELQDELPPAGGYVIVTRSTEISAELLESKPGVLPELVGVLSEWPFARQLYHARDGDIFFVQATPPRLSPRPAASSTARRRLATRGSPGSARRPTAPPHPSTRLEPGGSFADPFRMLGGDNGSMPAGVAGRSGPGY